VSSTGLRSTGLCSQVAVRLGLLDLDIELDVADGETVALLGPNGSGKTTALRALAGLLPIDAGRIALDGEVLDDPSSGTWIPPEHRSIGVVFQDYLLFPNLSARDNVAFGLRRGGMRKPAARAVADQWLDRMGLADHADNRPRQLSGGQAQRVALARALATEPRLLLLDEPLAALDAGTRSDLRSDLRRHLASFPGVRVLVTHDPVDALALADRVAVLESGRVVQTGTVADIAARPRSRYVADLVGVNLLRGHAHGATVALDPGTVTIADPAEGPVWVLVHPTAVALHRDAPVGSPRNSWRGTVTGLDLRGDRVRVRLDAAPPIVAEVTADAVRALDIEHGTELWIAVKATEIAVYPR
jgi:molybdate transport system ATP-binding protein